MSWYDIFARFYDAALERSYAEHRVLAAEALAPVTGSTVLDLPCGTGASFPALAQALQGSGRIVGIDASAGMLRKAAARGDELSGVRVQTLQADVGDLAPERLQAVIDGGRVERLHVFLGMSAFADMEGAFERLWQLLASGGRAVLVDVHAERLSLQGFMVNRIARADIRRRFWQPLEARALDFELRELPFRAEHGGRIMLASGQKG